ncbi:MAG: hypothetical protein V1809_02585 [Planctomycetota bacterium]
MANKNTRIRRKSKPEPLAAGGMDRYNPGMFPRWLILFVIVLILISITGHVFLFAADSPSPTPPPAKGAAPSPATSEPPPGQIHMKIATRHDPKQTYALYLPKNYTPSRKWPILYGFSPTAEGRHPAQLFRDAAERFGWIVVGSNNARNGPSEPINDAIAALWKDTWARYSIDETRLYATGFSGGARVAYRFAMHAEKTFAGIVPCGAGLPQGGEPAKNSPFAVHALAGLADFNYPEMWRVSFTLTRLGIRNRFTFFDGEHHWPSPAECGKAIRYMELLHLCRKEPGGGKTGAELLQEEINDAETILKHPEGLLTGYGRFRELEGLAADGPARETIRGRLKALDENPAFQKERAAADAVGKTLAEMATAGNLSRQLPIALDRFPDIIKEQAGTVTARNVERLLNYTGMGAARSGMETLQNKSIPEALFLLGQARRVFPADIRVLYGLASAQALSGKTDDALKTLAEAAKLGLPNPDGVEKDPNMESLRGKKAFQEILDTMRKKPAPPPPDKP